MIKVSLATIVALLIFSIPFFLPESTYSIIGTGTNIISAASSLVTLLIGLLLYNKFGIDKSLRDKQTEVVFQLFTELKKTRFEVQAEGLVVNLALDIINYHFYEDYKDALIAFDVTYRDGLKNIWDIADNVFLPREIAEKFSTLRMESLTGVNKEERDKHKYMLVTLPGYSPKREPNFFGVLNNEDMTVRDFINKWHAIIKTSEGWLKKNSNMDATLNFDRVI